MCEWEKKKKKLCAPKSIGGSEADDSTLKSEVSKVGSDVSQLSGVVANVGSDVSQLSVVVDNVQFNMASLQDDIEVIKASLDQNALIEELREKDARDGTRAQD